MDKANVENIQGSLSITEYKCKHCPRAYLNKTRFRYHNITHDKENTFSCNKCQKVFPIKSLLTIHIDRVHEKKLQELCFVCNKKFFDKNGLRSHLKTHDVSRSVELTYLPEDFVPELKQVGRVCLDNVMVEVDSVCSVCLKIFMGGKSRKRHEELHAKKSRVFYGKENI